MEPSNFPPHPLETKQSEEGIKKVQEFVVTYGPYITLALILFRFYTQFRLNKTLARIEKKLK